MKKYLFLVIIFFTACSVSNSETESEDLKLGEFNGLVGASTNTGLYEELEGLAQFSLESSDSTFHFILYSYNTDTTSTEVIFSIKSLDVPGTGEYSFNNIEDTTQVYATGFSGFYLSPTAGLGEQYYTESGTLTITRSESVNGIDGVFEAVIFYKAQVNSSEYVRQYSKISGKFNAASMNLR